MLYDLHFVIQNILAGNYDFRSSKFIFRLELRFGFPRTSVGKTSSQEAEQTSSMPITNTFCGRSPSPLLSFFSGSQSKGEQIRSKKTSSSTENQLITLDVEGNRNSISISNIASMMNIRNFTRNSFN